MTPEEISNIEAKMWQTVFFNPNMAVPWYLMAAFAYYQEDDPIFEDQTFDQLAKNMLDIWGEIEHYHKHLITVEDLQAGTLLLTEYPSRVIGGLGAIRREYGTEKS